MLEQAIAALGPADEILHENGRRIALYTSSTWERGIHFSADLIVTCIPKYCEEGNDVKCMRSAVKRMGNQLAGKGSLWLTSSRRDDHLPLSCHVWDASAALDFRQQVILRWSHPAKSVPSEERCIVSHQTLVWMNKKGDAPRFKSSRGLCDVWKCRATSSGFPQEGAHCVVGACGRPGGLLFDPFCAKPTTLVAAVTNDMDAIGFVANIEQASRDVLSMM